MRVQKFEHFQPATVAEACRLLEQHGPGASIIAGGTDLMVRMRYGVAKPEYLINLKEVEELKGIRKGEDGLHIGALTTLTDIRRSPLVQEQFPVLAEAALAVGAAQLQNMGTIGGNICLEPRCWYFQQGSSWRKSRPDCFKNGGSLCYMAKGSKRCYALYCGDTAAPLLALDARVRLVGPQGERTIPIDNFFIDDGIRHTDLRPGELLAEVIIPGSGTGQCGTYLKYRKRGAVDFPIAGVAAVIDREFKTAWTLRVAVTGVGSSPVLIAHPEEVAPKSRLTPEVIEQIAEAARRQVKPVSQMDVSPAYRKELVQVLVTDALEKLI